MKSKNLTISYGISLVLGVILYFFTYDLIISLIIAFLMFVLLNFYVFLQEKSHKIYVINFYSSSSLLVFEVVVPSAAAKSTFAAADITFDVWSTVFGTDLKIGAGSWKDGNADGAYRVKKDVDAGNAEGVYFERFKLGSAFKNAKKLMFNKAEQMGANAVVGVDIDYETISNMLMITASGTAVVVE